MDLNKFLPAWLLKPKPLAIFGDRWQFPAPEMDKSASLNLTYTNTQVVSFNGEKTPGGAGPLIEYRPDYISLRIRSWQAMLESDFAQIAMNKLVVWVIGKGLKIQSEPVESILKEEGITLDKKKFSKSVEARFGLWKKNKCVDYSGQKNLDELCAEAEKNAQIGGDVLVVLRVIKGELKIQLIDSQFVESPYYGSEWFPQDLPDGHLLIDGVEINEKREHIAYYVKVYAVDAKFENLYKYKFERIPAYGSQSGILMAYLYYGYNHRVGNVRGIPLLSACFEKLNNLDLYSAATLKQAQEAAKVDYQVIHHRDAEPNAPFAKTTAFAVNGQGPPSNNQLPVTVDGDTIGSQTHITGIGTAWNNSPGSEVKTLENKNPLYFKEFFETHSDILFAVIQLPPNVGMGKYNDSYSASRAAIKDFENTLTVKREHHQIGFLTPIVNLWMDIEALTNRIQAPGYTLARASKNVLVLNCYRNVRFIGPQVPGIDPLKEVMAARAKLGAAGVNLPMADLENVIEGLGGGDAYEIMKQFSDELSTSLSLGIKPEPIVQISQPADKKKKKDKPKD